MNMLTKQGDKTQMSAYSEFLQSVRPIYLGLDQSSTTLNRVDYWKKRDKPLQRVLSAEYSLSKIKPDYFDISVSYEFAIRASGNTGDRSKLGAILQIKCRFEGHFHAHAPVDAGHAEQFAEKDSWLIFWPYFRQFVSDATARMSIPPELLPLGLGPGTFSRTQPVRGEEGEPKRKRKAIKPKD